VVDDKVFISAGGKENNIVALNKNTGATIWSCAGDGDESAYCSPLYVANQQVPQIVTVMASHIIGIDVATGKKLWSYPYVTQRSIHPNTPTYDEKDMIFCTSGYGKGAVMLRFTDGGRSVEKVWEKAEVESRHGGIVKLGDYMYMGGDPANKHYFCVEWNTGDIKYKDNTLASNGVVITSDGLLLCYTEKGDMVLARVSTEKFDIVSKFPITLGTDQHWAHPVIYQGVLYVRHGTSLMAYKIK
jgi:outer membrane protein assembly factor BamB